jgi:hypothetical protein
MIPIEERRNIWLTLALGLSILLAGHALVHPASYTVRNADTWAYFVLPVLAALGVIGGIAALNAKIWGVHATIASGVLLGVVHFLLGIPAFISLGFFIAPVVIFELARRGPLNVG